MLQHLFTKAPLLAVLGASIVFIIVASAGMGLEWPLLLAVATSLFAASEGVLLWQTLRQKKQLDRHLRHIRFLVDRFQALVQSAPSGYCLFTPQGLLRETHGVGERLGVSKIAHLDDLIGAVKEGPELLGAFRKLQMTGEPFVFPIQSVKNGKSLVVIARRFRIGAEGPHVDVLWFAEPSGEGGIPSAPPKTEASAMAAAKAPVSEAVAVAPEAGSAGEKAPKADLSMAEGLRQAFDLFSFPAWARAGNQSLVWCNEAYAKAVGVSAKEALEAQHEIVSPSPKGEDGRSLAAKALEKGAALSERMHVVVAGQRRLLDITEVPAPSAACEAGFPFALLGFAIDVTAEEEKETELRRHLVAHHEVMEHLGAAISIYGPDMRLEFYNRAYQRLWEAQESFLDDKPTFSAFLEDIRSRRRIPEQADFQKYKRDRLALFTSLLEPREDVMFLPDGTSLRVLIAPHPLGGLIFVYENVTDQLALETSYNTLMAVQRETIDNLAEGIAVFGPDGKLRLFNAALGTLWDLEPELLAKEPHVADLVERIRPLIVAKEDWAAQKNQIVSYALDRTPRKGRMERSDQKIIEYVTVPLPDGSVLNSHIDVTDSVRVEQALRASNAALAAADRLKSDFVANVSYQLRTPLNTITGFAEILNEQYFGKLNDRQREYTLTIKAESEKLTRLINDVLDLAMIEAGRMTLDRQPVSVADLLNDAKQMTAEWARQQSLDILIECPSDIGTFEVDEQRLRQVLFNLIGNAITYTPAGGHIALAAWKQDQWIVVSVLDTGVGIPQEDHDRVFGKFEKANKSLRQGGAGLGLSLVKSFIELHGGYVEILSDEKEGTRVSCFLPQKAQEKTDRSDAGA